MNIIQIINSQTFRQVLLIILLALAVFFASTGGIQNPDWSTLLRGIATSIISTVLSIYLLQDVKKSQPDISDLKEFIQKSLGAVNQSHFLRVDRNMDMGDEYWIDLISNLDTTNEPVWFVGTRLSWWLKTRTYREPLREKLIKRLKTAVEKPGKSEHKDEYIIHVLLSNPEWISNWKEFFKSIVDELVKAGDPKKAIYLNKLYWSKLKIAMLPPDIFRYSLISCGDRLTVTHYTSSGRSEDSPTLEIKKDSVIKQLYIDDLKVIESKAKVI